MTHTLIRIVRCLATGLFVLSLAAGAGAQELIGLSQTVSGLLSAPGDALSYQVTLTSTGSVMVMLRGSAAAGGYALEVHQGSASGPTVGTAAQFENEQTLEVPAPVAGAHTIVVRNAAAGTRSFELRVEQRAAIPTPPPTMLEDQLLWAGGDTLTYEVASASSDPLLVMVQGSAFATAYELEVHERTRNGPTVGTAREYGNDLSVEVPSPSVGTYVVLVRSVADGERAFDLDVEQRTTASVSPGTTRSDQGLWTIGDAWYYRVPTATTDPLLVMVQGSTFASAYELEVHEGSLSGPEVGVLREFESGQSMEIEAPVVGEYWVVVRAAAVDAEGFDLSIEQRPPILLAADEPQLGQPLWVAGDTWYYQVTSGGSPLLALLRGSSYSSGYSLEVHRGSLGGPSVGVLREGETGLGVEVQAPTPGVYFVVVRSRIDGEQQFDLVFEERPPERVYSGSMRQDQPLWAVGDTWYYQFSATTTDPLVVTLVGSSYASAYVLELREGSLAGTSVGIGSESGTGRAIELQTPTPGDYFIVVRSATDGERTYDLTVNQQVIVPLGLGAATADQELLGLGDTRYFAVTLDNAAAGLVVRMTGSDQAGSYEVTVHQGALDGPQVGSLRHAGYDVYIDVPSPEAGQYYVVVQNARQGTRSFGLQVDTAPAEIDSVTPDNGGNAGEVTVSVSGRFLQGAAALRLVGAGGEKTETTELTEVEGGTRLRGTLDLVGLAAGAADVIVEKESGEEVVLEDAFVVEEGGAADLWVEVVAPPMRVARESTVLVTYGNRGKIDSPSPWLAVGVQSDVPYVMSLGSPVAWPMEDSESQPGSDGGLVDTNLWALSRLGVGESGSLTIPLRPGGAGFAAVLAEAVENPDAYFAAGTFAAEAARAFLDGSPAIEASASSLPPCSDPAARDETAGVYPAGTILNWTNPYVDGVKWSLHFAKSIGCGDFIEMFQDGIAIGSSRASDTPVYFDPASEARCESSCLVEHAMPGVPRTGGISNAVVFCRGRCKTTLSVISPPPDPTYPATSRKVSEKVWELLRQNSAYNWNPKHDGALGCPSEWDAGTQSLRTDCLGFVQTINWPIWPEQVLDANERVAAQAARFRRTIDPGARCSGDGATALLNARRYLLNIVASCDPNAKYGPTGYGDAHAVSVARPLPYLITFENLETATASAQEVVVTDQLDPALVDLETFALGPIAFGSHVVTPPAGVTSYIEDVDLRPDTELIVRVAAELDRESGLATWRFTSLDPDTHLFTEDVMAGFLPPNTSPPAGEGSVSFTVQPLSELPTGSVITNSAAIVFDANEPILTEAWSNTLDGTAPSSAISSRPATSESTSFEVCWTGEDDGAGILDYTVLVAVDGGQAVEWLAHTTEVCATYEGQNGASYGFFVTARDGAGNVEPASAVPGLEVSVNVPATNVNSAGAGGEPGVSADHAAGAAGQHGADHPSAGAAGEPSAQQARAGAGGVPDAQRPVAQSGAAGRAAVSEGGTRIHNSVDDGGRAEDGEAGEPAGERGGSAGRAVTKGSAGLPLRGSAGEHEHAMAGAGGQAGDRGGADAGRDDSGCSCRTAHDSSSRPVALVLLALLTLCQRRRRPSMPRGLGAA
jgi:MYXO-CTERM domain-containing protein